MSVLLRPRNPILNSRIRGSENGNRRVISSGMAGYRCNQATRRLRSAKVDDLIRRLIHLELNALEKKIREKGKYYTVA
jgi:hypothetical protein